MQLCGHGPQNLEEAFPGIGRRMIQRDLKDLKDAGLVSVNYVRKAQGYVKEKQRPKFNEDTEPRRKAHLKRLNRLGRLMSGLENADIPLWEKKDNAADGDVREYFTARIPTTGCFPACRSGRGRGTLKSFAGLGIRSPMITGTAASSRRNSIWAGWKRRR